MSTVADYAAGHVRAEARLTTFLAAWLGAWPPAVPTQVVVWPTRDQPGWDGGRGLGLGVAGPQETVLSRSPRLLVEPEARDSHLLIGLTTRR